MTVHDDQNVRRVTRRNVVKGLGGLLMASSLGCSTTISPRTRFFESPADSIGLQLYTLGPDISSDIDAILARVAEIGFREIELPNLLGLEPKRLREAADRAGLTISSVHLPLVSGASMPGLTLGSDPGLVAETLGVLGASWAVAPLLMMPPDMRLEPGESFSAAIGRAVRGAGRDIWKLSAEQLNQAGSRLGAQGISVAYHNHNLEFAPVEDTSGWEILWHETDSELVKFEIDVGWVATAGLNPAEFLERCAGRVALVHVKDVARNNPVGYEISMRPSSVGQGTLDWNRILPAARNAGANHYFVEQEPPFDIPRIEAAARSYDFLSQIKV